MTETPSPKSKPLWLRLLPWLVVLMVLLGLLAICEPFVAQYRIIKWIESKGGDVGMEFPDWMPEFIAVSLTEEQTYYFCDVVWIGDLDEPFLDADIERLSRLSQLQSISLNNTHLRKDSLKSLGSLTNLDHLVLYDTQLSDEGLKYLSGLTKLILLDLCGTKISDDGLKYLSGLYSLQQLDLTATQVSDDGMKSLAGMTNLQRLYLSDTLISDEGLKYLSGLTNLEELDLDNTKVTPTGIKQLQLALPDCLIFQ